MLLPTGGVIDDVFVYGLKDTKRLLMIVNGSTHEKDVAWLRKNVASGVIISDLEGRAGFAIQGPKASASLKKRSPALPSFRVLRFSKSRVENRRILLGLSTGYTGEEGAEFLVPRARCGALETAFGKRCGPGP